MDDKIAKSLALRAFTGTFTDGLSGSIIERSAGVARAKCPLCPHMIEVVGLGFAVEDGRPGERLLIVCGACRAFLFITPPGFTPVRKKEFRKLPPEIRTLLERARERLRRYGTLLV